VFTSCSNHAIVIIKCGSIGDTVSSTRPLHSGQSVVGIPVLIDPTAHNRITKKDIKPMPQAESGLISVSTESFPQALLSEPYWLYWQPEWSEARNKYIKVPLHKSWQTQRHQFSQLPQPRQSGHGYGFIYSAEHDYICIDVDDGRPINARLVERLKSYSEWSPSGQGAHVIVRTTDKQALIAAFGNAVHNNTEKRDLYISTGYVTITGRLLPMFSNHALRTIPADELIEILSPHFRMLASTSISTSNAQVLSFPPKPAKKDSSEPTFSKQLIDKVLTALPVKYLPTNAFTDFPIIDLDTPTPPESRDAWLTVGQALHNISNDLTSYVVWSKWSEQGDKYDPDATYATWRSFNTGPNGGCTSNNITFATVLKLYYAQRPQYIDFTGEPPRLVPSLDNIKIYIAHAKITGRYNTVTNNLEIQLPPKLYSLLGTTDVKAVSYVVDSEMMKHGTRDGAVRHKAREILVAQASQNIYNPIVEYFTKTLIPWDKRSRIPELMTTIDCQAKDLLQYTTYVRKWLIQVMAAVFTTPDQPNRLNNVLILQGEQGVGKTNWVESLFPPDLRNYCVGSKSVNMSQFRNDMVKLGMELTNTLICNINEIDTVFSPKTYSEFKQFLDKTVDKVVLPYGATATDVLRRTVFIGSTNKYELFTDATGNRRFMLINAMSYDFKHTIDLNQLWAEAYYYYKQGEAWWLEDKVVLSQQRETNDSALTGIDESLLDQLNNMFDADDKKVGNWDTYTFPRVKALLSLNIRPNTQEFYMAKRTITQWLKVIAPSHSLVKIPKHQGTPWSCKLPPLKLE